MTINNLIRNIIVLVTVLLSQMDILGQKEIVFELNWGASPLVAKYQNIEKSIPNLENGYFDGESFKYFVSINKNSKNINAVLSNYTFTNTSNSDIEFINRFNIPVTESINFKRKTTEDREQLKEGIEITPFIRVNGQIKKINQITIQTNEVIDFAFSKRDFVANSVLQQGSGDWYKIRVNQNGVYELTYSFLQSIGIDVANLNPNHLNIYGNGFGILPEDNGDARPDDLIKNSILVLGDNDGSFDQGDKVIFYGRGPNRWESSGGYGFANRKNIYADYSAYFINISSSNSPLRIENSDLSSLPETNSVTDFNDYQIHEMDSRSLLNGGQRWYGEEFDVNLTQNFSFNFPNINPNESVRVKSAFAYEYAGGNSSFKIKSGSLELISESLGYFSGGYRRKELISPFGSFNTSNPNINLTCTFNRNSPADKLYLDFLEVNARRYLRVSENQMDFRDINSVGTGNVSNFNIENYNSSLRTWEVTDYNNPKVVNGTLTGSNYNFKVATDTLREFITFNTTHLAPTFINKVSSQNLHGLSQADNLIITNKLFIGQANRLANLHRAQGLTVHVVALDELYNEFSGGTQDATAIKTFAKMFFDRAEGDPNLMPKYLTLFGDATYDPKNRVNNNNYMVPTYHVTNSEDAIANLVSDDYFGLLGDNEGFETNDNLDIGVGRLLATTNQQAIELVNKIEHYMKNGSTLFSGSNAANCDATGYSNTQGSWRMKYSIIADDRDAPIDTFVSTDAEPAYEYVKANHYEMNANKIYLDSYEQIATAGGQRYPDAVAEINRNVQNGNILMVYVGHGGEEGAAQERVITINQINSWTNIDNMPLFVTATCEFTKFDDTKRMSAGEFMHLNPKGGAIALMTTTRSVYFGVNTSTNKKLFENVFVKEADGTPRSFGEIIRTTKNAVASGSENKRSFCLIGDPALKIALPTQKVVMDTLNGFAVTSYQDTMKALSKAQISGHLEDQFGNRLSTVNGILEPSIFDKAKIAYTLGQDEDFPRAFETQKNVLYKGRVSVTNGEFNFDFIVPKDINYNYGKGKASFYAYDSQISAGGFDSLFYIGGIDTNGLNDTRGPQIEITLNDENFVNGGITNEIPIIKASFFDESGINTVGNGIGHDITAVLDKETAKAIVLNEFYVSDLDTYKSGKVNYQLSTLEPGLHTLTIKAWDVNNNSSEVTLEFTVQELEDISLDHVLNYPNPFTTKTDFYFEHNQVCNSLKTQIEIFTVTGKLVKTINKEVKTAGFRSEGISWDGRDEYGDQLGKGVYIYKISVENELGDTSSEIQKLYLLK